MSHVVIREIEQKDLPTIIEMMDEAWDFKNWMENVETGIAATRLYLNQVLDVATLGRVAVVDHEVVGVIFGTVKGGTPIYRLLQKEVLQDMMTLMKASDRDRMAFVTYVEGIFEIYDELLTESTKDYGANIEFFVVSEKARGLGVGKKLWEALKSIFVDLGIQQVYVYTDTGCNFGFYDYQGFTRAGSRMMKTDDHAVDIFMYDIEL